MKLLEGNADETQSPAHNPNTMATHQPLSVNTNGHSDYSSNSSSSSNNKSVKTLNIHKLQSGANSATVSTMLANNRKKNFCKMDSSNSVASSLLLDSSPSPEGQEGGEYLTYTEDSHFSLVLAGINKMRRQGQFCDIKLIVEDHEFSAHRAVMAVCSPYLFDFLSCLEETTEQQPTYKLKDVPAVGFQYLLEFMYTGSLLVPLNQVPLVYATALLLKMESASRACAEFLSNHLTTSNCLGIRQFTKDSAFQANVDEYIRSNLKEIMSSKYFFGLTDLQVEVVGLDETISDEKMERRLFALVLDWAKTNLNDLKPKMDRLTEKVNVLYLQSDNRLRDCADVEDTVLSSDDDMVQDYKILARRRCKTHTKSPSSKVHSHHNNGSAHGFHIFNLNPEEAVSVAEREWSIVATRKTSENAYLAIAILDGRLMAISVHVRPPVAVTNGSETPTNGAGQHSPPISSSSNGSYAGQQSPIVRKASILPLEPMNGARCALGAVVLNNQIIVCGGYDRGECLSRVEAFSLPENKWTPLPSMNIGRGRFSAATLDNCIYVCGGSDGWKELSCVEKYDPVTNTWKFVANMMKERSSHGVVTLNGKLYCIGGCEGQRSISHCEVYDPATNKWSRIASLNEARSQTCVCALNGLLFAIGGTDLWNTLNTVEVYNPEEDQWTLHSQLNIARRGAGVEIVNGEMVVLGGSDGTQSLISTEIFDPVLDLWNMGPPLNIPRANLSAVTLDNRLFAVGGFSGKRFLSTLEWLDTENLEWLGHVPRVFISRNNSMEEKRSDVLNGSDNSAAKLSGVTDQAQGLEGAEVCGVSSLNVKEEQSERKKEESELEGSKDNGCENGLTHTS